MTAVSVIFHGDLADCKVTQTKGDGDAQTESTQTYQHQWKWVWVPGEFGEKLWTNTVRCSVCNREREYTRAEH